MVITINYNWENYVALSMTGQWEAVSLSTVVTTMSERVKGYIPESNHPSNTCLCADSQVYWLINLLFSLKMSENAKKVSIM